MGRVDDFEMREDSEFLLMKKYLEEFRKQLLNEIRQIVKENASPSVKKWLKSAEVKKMLDISHGKLQTMRKSGIITFSKIGGAIYYDPHDIDKMFNAHKCNG